MSRKTSSLTLVLALAWGCQKKQPPPPAPDIPVASVKTPTELPSETLTGTAEYGATIAVTRTPPLGAGEAFDPQALTADLYTGQFQLVVPLAPGQNSFAFTATDANGTSPATTVVINRSADAPVTVVVEPSNALVVGGQLVVKAIAANPEPVPLGGFEIDFTAVPASLDGGAGPSALALSAHTDGNGVAEVTFQGMETPGPWTVTATSKDNPLATSSAQVIVGAGFGSASLELVMTGKDATGKVVVSKAGQLTVAAGSPITVQLAAQGQDQGPFLDVAFTLSTNAPHAAVLADALTGITTASELPYEVVAAVSPSSATGDVLAIVQGSLTVVPATADHFALTVATSTVAGASVPVGLGVADAYGNGYALTALPAISTTDAAATVTPGALAAGALSGASIVFRSVGAQTVTAISTQFPGLTQGQSAQIRVLAGPPAVVVLTLAASSTAAGVPLGYSYSVTDSQGNALAGLPVQISSTAPGAIAETTGLAQGQLSNLTTAGTFSVWATVVTTGLTSPVQTFQVTPGAASQLHFELASANAFDGNADPFSWYETDASGNLVQPIGTLGVTLAQGPSGGQIQSSVVAPAPGAHGSGTVTPSPGSPGGIYTVEAQVDGLSAFATILVSLPQDTVPPTVTLAVTDATGASLNGASVTAGQNLIVTITACDDTAIGNVLVQFSGAYLDGASGVPTSSAPSGSCPAGDRSASWTQLFTVPGGSQGTEKVVASATDSASNVGLSALVTFGVNPFQVDTNVINPATGIATLGQGSLPLAGPVGIALDSSNASDTLIYLSQNARAEVVKYDSLSDAYSIFSNAGGVGLGAQGFDLVKIGGVLYESQNNNGVLQGGGGSGAVVAIPIATPGSPTLFADAAKSGAVGFMPAGLANCAYVSAGGLATPALLALDDQTGPGGSGNEQADFLELTGGAQFTGGSAFQLFDNRGGTLGNPFGGVTGTNADGSCATVGGSADVIFTADDASQSIWWMGPDPVNPQATVLVAGGGQTCRLNGGPGNPCVRDPIGVRLTAGGHLVWANSANGTVMYAKVNPANGAVLAGPATLIRQLNTPAGLSLDSANHLYVVDNQVKLPSGGLGAVYRFTLVAGF